jgi:hypothetical protein
VTRRRSLFCPGTRLVEEVAQGLDDQLGCFFGQDILSTGAALTSIDATSASR